MDLRNDIWAGIFVVTLVTVIAVVMGMSYPGILALLLTVLAWRALTYLQARTTARTAIDSSGDYRQLAEQTSSTQSEILDQLTHLESIETRLSEVERMLREVDEPVLAR